MISIQLLHKPHYLLDQELSKMHRNIKLFVMETEEEKKETFLTGKQHLD